MDIKEFLNTVCKEIKYKPVKQGIYDELENHIQELKENYINDGIQAKQAEEKAVMQMGEAEKIGKKLNKIHRPKVDWKLLILIVILMVFGLAVSILKQINMNDNYILKTAIYMAIGISLSVIVYLLDYRKLKKHSTLIYIIALIIMILPMTRIGTRINGIDYIKIFNTTFRPNEIATTLFIISFIGYISNYNKNKKIQIFEGYKLEIDFIKLYIVISLSLALMLNYGSIISGIILGLIYLVIITVKIVQNKEKRVIRLGLIYIPILVLSILVIIAMSAVPYRSNRIVASFKPETDPNGVGYEGMLKKEVLENAKFIGQAETEIISNNNYNINFESNYTFIYLLGRAGMLVSGILVLTILLTSIKLILNAKNIKDQYGKLLIVGLSTLYIIQSIANILMNINMGIVTNINLPFVTYGGVYFIVSILNIALIFSVYKRKDINLYC